MPTPTTMRLSPREDGYTTPSRSPGRGFHKRPISTSGRSPRTRPRSPGGGFQYAGSPGRGAYSARELGSPGGRVVDVERYTRDVPRTIFDQDAFDVRAC